LSEVKAALAELGKPVDEGVLLAGVIFYSIYIFLHFLLCILFFYK